MNNTKNENVYDGYEDADDIFVENKNDEITESTSKYENDKDNDTDIAKNTRKSTVINFLNLNQNEIKIDNVKFISDSKLFLAKMSDYNIISNIDFSKVLNKDIDELITMENNLTLPSSIKNVLNTEWMYSCHIAHKNELNVLEKTLYARVTGGQILCYKYKECSIGGNRVAYFGFVPTKIKVNLVKCMHRKPLFSKLTSNWPRELYIYLKYLGPCPLSNENIHDCHGYFNVKLRNGKKKNFCFKKIPWNKVFIMMGEMKDCNSKRPRDCVICNSCTLCRKMPVYCRLHKVCSHQNLIIYTPEINSKLKRSQMKPNRRLNNFVF